MQPLFWMTGFKFSIIFNLFLAATWYNGLIFVTLYVLLKKTVVYWLLLKNFIFTISLQTVIKAKGHENSESETCVKWTPLTSRHQQRSLGSNRLRTLSWLFLVLNRQVDIYLNFPKCNFLCSFVLANVLAIATGLIVSADVLWAVQLILHHRVPKVCFEASQSRKILLRCERLVFFF